MNSFCQRFNKNKEMEIYAHFIHKFSFTDTQVCCIGICFILTHIHIQKYVNNMKACQKISIASSLMTISIFFSFHQHKFTLCTYTLTNNINKFTHMNTFTVTNTYTYRGFLAKRQEHRTTIICYKTYKRWMLPIYINTNYIIQ